MEFGSDFHNINIYNLNVDNWLFRKFKNIVLYASGRHPLVDICKQNGYKRLWMPQYFCYEVVKYVERAGIKVIFYENFPGFDDTKSINAINFRENDVLLRVNYFGLYKWKDSACYNVDIIEDHTHNIISDWAINSNAKWCIASLRKTFPIAGGGCAWSPQGEFIQPLYKQDANYLLLFNDRWNAMNMKTDYLSGIKAEKEDYLTYYADSEELFDILDISPIYYKDENVIKNFDYRAWFNNKKRNWEILKKSSFSKAKVIMPESDDCLPFSLLFLFDESEDRNMCRKILIENAIYPAILWNIPKDRVVSDSVRDLSERILSVHCDGRYSEADILLLKNKLEQII